MASAIEPINGRLGAVPHLGAIYALSGVQGKAPGQGGEAPSRG